MSKEELGNLDIRDVEGGVRISVHIQPQAFKTAVVGQHGDALKVRVKAPPVEGKANEELIRFVATWLGVGKRDVELVHGQTSRQKVVEVRGVSRAEVLQKIQDCR